MYTDYAKHAIIMTKTEAREAGKYGSDKFNELNGLRAAAPNYQIMITKTPKGNRCFARLTYADMERYIKAHNVDVTVGEETKHAWRYSTNCAGVTRRERSSLKWR